MLYRVLYIPDRSDCRWVVADAVACRNDGRTYVGPLHLKIGSSWESGIFWSRVLIFDRYFTRNTTCVVDYRIVRVQYEC